MKFMMRLNIWSMRLQIRLSIELMNMGFPKVDPHESIPTIDGQIFYNSDEFSLDSLNFGQTCELVRFESLDSSYLNYLSQNGFAIGASIKVIEQFDFDQSFWLKLMAARYKLQIQLLSKSL